MMMRFSAMAVLITTGATFCLADWPQWRGPARNGAALPSAPLIDALPKDGLKRAWASEKITSHFDGGWGSPVVANGRVYLMSHAKTLKEGVKDPGKRQYPWLAPDKRGHLTPAEYETYEVNRRDEDEKIAQSYEFTETVYCFDAESGSTLWKSKHPSVYTRFVQSSTPAVAHGKLYYLGAERTAHCVDAATGQRLWQQRLPGEFRDEYFMSSFVVSNGVAAVFANALYGLNADTGDILWKTDPQAGRGMHTSPIAWTHNDQAMLIANINDGQDQTACFDLATGKILWRIPSAARDSTPLLADSNTLITYGSSRKSGMRCYRITPRGAEEKWVYQGTSDAGSSPLVHKDHVYVQGGIKVACVDLKNGEEKWQATLPMNNPRYTSPVLADGKIWFAWEGVLCFAAEPDAFKRHFDGKIDADGLLADEDTHRRLKGLNDLDPKEAQSVYTSKVIKTGPVNCTTPAFSNGRMYVRTPAGLFCFDLKKITKEL